MKNQWIKDDRCGTFTRETIWLGKKAIEKYFNKPRKPFLVRATEAELNVLRKIIAESLEG